MHGWQANKKRTCASPVVGRAMPENEKPPAMRVDNYYILFTGDYNLSYSLRSPCGGVFIFIYNYFAFRGRQIKKIKI